MKQRKDWLIRLLDEFISPIPEWLTYVMVFAAIAVCVINQLLK